ncbi:RING finger protein 17 [Lingula anatina]|uniref:RING finger protein 17 n=1 Tax=Lingula anatina TaxID=7574 RepID=A0A1S3K1R6_LINAN|nr:RING finger protein 17 [Lingula anatina]|eukprot:XP_013416573.1 RING finger protein 17 [Lingula anatina]
MQKNPTCPACCHTFGTKDPARPHGPRMPLLLRCGHTYCESCLFKLAKFHKTGIPCPSCKVLTQLKEEGSIKCLEPNIYLLGLLSAQRRKSVASNNSVLNFTPAGMLPRKKKSSLEESEDCETKVPCKECNFNPATCCCLKCDVTMCGICFDRVHSASNTLRKHQAVPIYESGLSLGGSVCKDHDNRAIEYFCEDDQTAICSHCVIVGEHKSHAISSMEDKNKTVFADMEPVINTAAKVLKNLKKSEKVLNDGIPDSRVTAIQLVEEVQSHFQTLHGLLQAREIELTAEIETACAEQIMPMEDMKLNIVEESKRIEFLLKDARKVMNNNNQLILNANEILSKLQSIETFPCHCVPVVEEEQLGVKVQFTEDFKNMIPEYGKIQSTPINRFELVPLSEIVDKGDDRTSEISDDVIIEEEIEESLSTDGSLSTSQHSQHSSGTGTSVSATDTIAHRKKMAQRTKVNFVRQELVYVTHIKNPSHFIIQRVADVERLKSLARNMNKWCNGDKAERPSSACKDDLVLCQYALDNCWYRARVKDILWDSDTTTSSKPKIEVYYIDYGNTEIVPLEKVRAMQNRFLRVPELAVQCALLDLVPADKTNPQWSLEAIQSFAKMTEDKPMLMSVVKNVNNVMHVDLSKPPNDGIQDDRPVSMRDSLVFLELACLATPESTHVTSGPMLLPARRYLHSELPEIDDILDVVISHVDSPSSFYVQQTNDEARYFSQMMEELQTVYNNTEDLYAVLCPQKDMVCVAQYHDNLWYRAQVTRLPGRRMVEIQYVDFGNSEIISHLKLRKILDRHLVLPAQGLHCSLADIEPVDVEVGWSPQVVDQFKTNVFQQRVLRVKGFLDQCLSVLLCAVTDSGEVCFNAYLVNEGLAVSTGPGSKPTSLAMPNLISYGKNQCSATEDLESIPGNNQVHPNALNLVDSGICLENQEVANIAKDAKIGICDPVVSQIAQGDLRTDELSEEDMAKIHGGWHRPQSVVQASPASVTSGVTDLEVNVASAGQAESQKDKKPCHSTIPEIERDCDWFGDINTEKKMKLGKSATANKEQSVKIRKSKKLKDVPGTPIIVSHVESPTLLYVRTVDGETDLNKLMNELDEQFSKTSPVQLTLEPEDVCAAKSTTDGRWYRAKVLSILSNDFVQVHMLDFGFEEKLKMEMLRPLEARFIEYNLFAIRCHLTDICAAGDRTRWSKTACEHFKELIADAECNIEPKGELTDGSLPIDLIMIETLEGDALTPATTECRSFSKILVEEGLAIPVRKRSQVAASLQENNERKATSEQGQLIVQSNTFSDATKSDILPTQALAAEVTVAPTKDQHSEALTEEPLLSETMANEPVATESNTKESRSPVDLPIELPPNSLLLKKRKKREELAQPPTQFPPFELPPYPGTLTVIPTYVGIDGVIYAQEYKSDEDPEGRLGYILQESTLEVKVQDKYLQSIGMKRYKIIADGNCLFRAFAQGIFQDQNQHLIVRSAVIQALQEQWDVFKDIIYEDDKMKYIQNLAKPGSYGGEVEIQVVCYIYDIQTVLYMNGLHTPVLTRTYGAGSADVVELIFLSDGRVDNGHYDLAIPSSLCVPNPDYAAWRQMRICEMQQHADRQDVTSFDDSTLAQLMDVLQHHYQNTEPDLNVQWAVDQACVARFSQDMHWYRGRVLEINEQGILVHYIDFGNNEYVLPENLRSDVILTQIPQQCLECILFGIKPNTADGHWTKSFTEFIHDTIVGVSCIMELQMKPKEGEPLAVSITTSDDRHLEQILLFLDIAVRYEDQHALPVTSEEVEQGEDLGPYTPLELPAVNELFTAIVTQVDAVDKMYIQKCHVEETEDPKVYLANQQLEALLSITMELNASAENYPSVETISEGMACVAQFTADGCWYRGLVIKVEEICEAAVLYVDYGNKEIVPKERLRHIPEEFLSLPAQAAPVKIEGLISHSIHAATLEDVQLISNELGDSVKVAVVKAHGFPASIELYTHVPCPGQPKPYAYQSLIDQGIIEIQSEESDLLYSGAEATSVTYGGSEETVSLAKSTDPRSELSWYDQTANFLTCDG